MSNILYLCNGKNTCGKASNFFCGVCSYDETTDFQCFHTTDSEYALNGPVTDDSELYSDRFVLVNDYYTERKSYVKD